MSEMTAIGSEISLKDEDDRVFGAQLPAASRGTARGGWTFLACGGLGGTAYKVRRECGRACRPSSTESVDAGFGYLLGL